MDAVDQLMTITEVGATFAGFTAIAGVMASDTLSRTKAKIHFWIMIEFSFALIAFALFPIVLFNFTLQATDVWMISSGVMVTFLPIHLLTVVRLVVYPAMKRGEFEGRLFWIFLPLFATVLLIQAANAVGIGFERTFAAYFLGLAFFVLLVFTNFASLLAQIWVSDTTTGMKAP